MKCFFLFLCLAIFLIFPQPFLAAEVEVADSEMMPPALYFEKFERLDSPKGANLKEFYGGNMAIAIFGPDCIWCKKQHQVLKALKNECLNMTTVMMGIGSEKSKLNKDLRRSQNTFPAFRINNNLLNALENSNVPRLLVFDHKGRATLNASGFISEDNLKKLLNGQLYQKC
jgi:thioredoxin-related protein